MQKVMFTSEECDIIINGIENHQGTTNYDIDDRKYKEWLILNEDILNLILEKLKIIGVKKIKEGRVLKYEKGGFFDEHTDTFEKYPHRYKTVIIQLSDENEYKGGTMTFGDEILNKEIGNTAIFLGTTIHSMKKIEEGIRYAFVIWLERNDFDLKKALL